MMAAKNRRAEDSEDRASWREYLKIYSERLKMELDLLPQLKKDTEETKALVSRAMIILVGNGTVENSICYRVSQAEKDVKLIDAKLNGILGTDNWRRDVLIKAISTVVTAILVAALLLLLGIKK
jgi:hypothetical protein